MDHPPRHFTRQTGLVMPDKTFLETYPLYRKFDVSFSEFQTTLGHLDKPAIHMRCFICGSDQTFNMVNDYWENINPMTQNPHTVRIADAVVRAVYVCKSCNKFTRYFLLKFDPDGKYVMKVGQEPPWDISVDRNLERALGSHAEYYKKGLICESQGYGIGAFSYYRRIVEEIIDQLLSEITDLIDVSEQECYLKALEDVRKTTVTQEKIQLVKDLLPSILRPDGINPLGVLHSTLSEGLHEQSDEHCLKLAEAIRRSLVFLVSQVIESRSAARSFTESMRSLLDRKSG